MRKSLLLFFTISTNRCETVAQNSLCILLSTLCTTVF